MKTTDQVIKVAVISAGILIAWGVMTAQVKDLRSDVSDLKESRVEVSGRMARMEGKLDLLIQRTEK